jgi:phosphopantetheinyl transferase
MIIALYSNLITPAPLLPECAAAPVLAAHIARYAQAEDRVRSACAWYLAYLALARLGKASLLSSVRFSASGQPLLDGWYLSLSHSGRFAAAALSALPVGIDVEQVPADAPDKLARRCLSQQELAVYAAAPDAAEYFCRCWTAKEAFVKREGTGLCGFPSNLTLTAADGQETLSGGLRRGCGTEAEAGTCRAYGAPAFSGTVRAAGDGAAPVPVAARVLSDDSGARYLLTVAGAEAVEFTQVQIQPAAAGTAMA